MNIFPFLCKTRGRISR